MSFTFPNLLDFSLASISTSLISNRGNNQVTLAPCTYIYGFIENLLVFLPRKFCFLYFVLLCLSRKKKKQKTTMGKKSIVWKNFFQILIQNIIIFGLACMYQETFLRISTFTFHLNTHWLVQNFEKFELKTKYKTKLRKTV